MSVIYPAKLQYSRREIKPPATIDGKTGVKNTRFLFTIC